MWIFATRKSAQMKNTTYTFLVKVCVGICWTSLSTLFLSWDDRERYELVDGHLPDLSPTEIEQLQYKLDRGCMMVPILFFGGLMATFLPLLLKTWRLVELFNNKKLKIKRITNSYLIKIEIALVIIPAIILVLWTIVAPLHWERVILKTDPVSQRPIESNGYCTGDNQALFIAPLSLILLSTLLYGNILTFKARKIPSKFSEGIWIGIALNNILESIILTVPVMFYSAENPVLDVIVKCMLTTFGSFGTLAVIFGPKLWHWYFIGRVDTSSQLYTQPRSSGPKTFGQTAHTAQTANLGSVKSSVSAQKQVKVSPVVTSEEVKT